MILGLGFQKKRRQSRPLVCVYFYQFALLLKKKVILLIFQVHSIDFNTGVWGKVSDRDASHPCLALPPSDTVGKI